MGFSIGLDRKLSARVDRRSDFLADFSRFPIQTAVMREHQPATVQVLVFKPM
jgi:hypothetical protein